MTPQSTRSEALKIRGRLVASHQIPVLSLNPEQFELQLTAATDKAPALFLNAPVVLDISFLQEIEPTDLRGVIEICQANKLIPYALTSEHTNHKSLTNHLHLAWVEFKNQPGKRITIQAPQQTKIISTPVRSGQQIYAKDANLVVMNLVSAGAEVIADGYIHVFGPLRGRAIAGASGYSEADIICQKMSAELIAIAGTYLLQDKFADSDKGARCSLDNASIQIDYI
ncbi:MAG: septum site-determining protein MinC [Reinekea sp.]|jgi:septum site-determining protein MinC